VLFQSLNYSLVWSDVRLFSAPCFGALPQMLSMSQEDGQADVTRQQIYQERARYWLPAPTFKPLKPGFKPVEETATLESFNSMA
jgi:hypothetical protein